MTARSSRHSVATKRRSWDTPTPFPSFLLRWYLAHPLLSFAILSAASVLALYWMAMRAPFVYDDLDQIANNPALGSWHRTFVRFCLSPVAFTNDFRGAGGSTYRPVYWLSLALDRRIWGTENAGGFHFTNVLLHWLNGLALFSLLRRVGVTPLTTFAAVLLWLSLPINSEAVAWVSARSYLLCGLFLLLSLLMVDLYLRDGRRLALAGTFVGCLLALLSHEEGMLLLPLAVLLAYATGRVSRRLWELAGTILAVDLLYLLLRHWVGAQAGKGSPALWPVGLTFWTYVRWILAPVHMSVERSTSVPPDGASIAAIAAWAGVLALFGVVFVTRKRLPTMAAGLAWVCVASLPFCGAVFIYQGMAERFEYVASLGFAVAAASLALGGARVWRGVGVAVMVLWMTWGAFRLRSRVADWSDPVRLYRSSIEATPRSSTLFYNLGFSLRQRGDLAGAAEAYREAARILPSYQRAFASLGEVDAEAGEPGEAAKAFRHALDLQPNDGGTALNLAVALQQTGQKKDAEEQFRRAIALAPADSAAYTDLGAMLFEEGRVDEAIRCFQSAMEIRPSDPNPYFNLAVLFQQSGRDDLALRFYRKVLELKPGDPDTIRNVSRLHLGR